VRFLRWVLVLPLAVLGGMAGSIAGGLVASSLGQAVADTASAFVGPLAFVLPLDWSLRRTIRRLPSPRRRLSSFWR
jgi:hypothetical protein